MSNLIITAGDLYIEIDVLACAIAYSELLEMQGKKVRIILRGPMNKSITQDVKLWGLKFETKARDFEDAQYIILDISDPNHISSFVDQSKIIEFFDHHPGFEDYWKSHLNAKVKIEKVGACATLVWEEFKKAKLQDKISWKSANLITTAIISNTLNFKAAVTHERDIKAYQELQKHTKLPLNWTEKYFTDQEEETNKFPEKAVKEDTIIIIYPNIPFKIIAGQLELWNSKQYIAKHLESARKALDSYGEVHWFLTSPSISEGKNYLYAENEEMQNLLSDLLNIRFRNNLAETNKLILRKEIKKMLLDYRS